MTSSPCITPLRHAPSCRSPSGHVALPRPCGRPASLTSPSYRPPSSRFTVFRSITPSSLCRPRRCCPIVFALSGRPARVHPGRFYRLQRGERPESRHPHGRGVQQVPARPGPMGGDTDRRGRQGVLRGQRPEVPGRARPRAGARAAPRAEGRLRWADQPCRLLQADHRSGERIRCSAADSSWCWPATSSSRPITHRSGCPNRGSD